MKCRRDGLPIKTKVFTERERKQLYLLVLEELQAGHQAFVVLPAGGSLRTAPTSARRHADGREDAPDDVQRFWRRFGPWPHGKRTSATPSCASFATASYAHSRRHHRHRSRHRHFQRNGDRRRARRAFRPIATPSTPRAGWARQRSGLTALSSIMAPESGCAATIACDGTASPTVSKSPKPTWQAARPGRISRHPTVRFE